MASRSVADIMRRVRSRVTYQANLNKSAAQKKTKRPVGGGKCVGRGVEPLVIGAVVPTMAVTEELAVPLSCTEGFERLQVGCAAVCGVMAQERATVPVKELDGVKFKVKVALLPALTVCDVGAAVAAEKSGDPETERVKLWLAALPTPLLAVIVNG